VREEGLINLGEALENSGVCGKLLAHFDEGANDIDAHGDSAWVVQDIGRRESAVFGECADLF